MQKRVGGRGLARRPVTAVTAVMAVMAVMAAAATLLTPPQRASATVIPLDCSQPQPVTRRCGRSFEMLANGAVEVPTNARLVMVPQPGCDFRELTAADYGPELGPQGSAGGALLESLSPSLWTIRVALSSLPGGLSDFRFPGFVREGPELEPNRTYLVVDSWGMQCQWLADQCGLQPPTCAGVSNSCCDVPTGASREVLRFRTAAGPDLLAPGIVFARVGCYVTDILPEDPWMSVDADFDFDEDSDIVELQLFARRDDEAPIGQPVARFFRANGGDSFEHINREHPHWRPLRQVILPEGSPRRDDPALADALRVEDVSGRFHYSTRAIDWAGNVGHPSHETTITIPGDCGPWTPRGTAPAMSATPTAPTAPAAPAPSDAASPASPGPAAGAAGASAPTPSGAAPAAAPGSGPGTARSMPQSGASSCALQPGRAPGSSAVPPLLVLLAWVGWITRHRRRRPARDAR